MVFFALVGLKIAMTNSAEVRAPETSTSLSVGDVVADRYRIDAVLGEGGMGVVYRAEHLRLRKVHALKVLLAEWSSMPEVAARFEREAVAAGNIQSPHVVAATDFGRLPSGSFFLVMEYVNGRTLRAALEAGGLDPARALHVLRGVVSALHAAHALGIVHRDMKPENIMLVERDGDPDFVKVLDFGIAKVEGFAGSRQGGTSKALTQVGAVIGTPDYMSPEQALGQPIDARADLYSVGIILFEMLTGRRPFVGEAVTVLMQHVTAEVPELPPAVAAGVDPRVGAVLRRLLAKAPENRFESAAELLAALEPCSNDGRLPAPAAPMSPGVGALEGAVRGAIAGPGTLLPRATRGRLAVAAVVVAVVATTVGLLVVVGRPRARASSDVPVTADSAAAVATTSAAPIPAAMPTDTVDVAPVAISPLPPTPPSSSMGARAQRPRQESAKPAPSQGQSRRTGPGGIYIPPPSQWFK